LTLPLRAWTPLRMVLTVCGRCFADDPDREIDYETDVLQGNLVAMDGRVYLRRICRRGHGEVMSLYEEDGALWEDLQQWRIPTREVVPDRPGNTRPIPMGYLDGLGDLQTQHSCLVLIDVTETCNLECPTCFAISSPGAGRHAPEPAVMRTLDAAIAREGGRVDALMLSGGEPTVHPGILDLVRAATERNVTRVILNTNGIRIARDDAFLHELAKLRDRVEIYLQFDGFRESTYRWHRGEDLRAVKDAAIRRLTDARIFTTLAVAVARGVNDDEVGAIVDLALDTDYLAGVAVQPMFGAGRANAFDPMDRATTTGTIRRLGPQTNGRVSADDFIALPCSHPDCATLTYLVRRDDGQYRSVVSMIGRDRLKEHMAVYGNRLAPDDALWDALTGLLSETTLVSRPEMIDHLLDICEVCDLGVSGFVKTLGRWVLKRDGVPVELLAKRVKRISVKTFMDAWTMNVERLQQCCVHVGATGPDEPVRIPFCARQTFGALRRRTSEGMVAARDLPLFTAQPPKEVSA
jgi:7,8-dihydro-6-hydroxymethylpterin dimethyltransferase